MALVAQKMRDATGAIATYRLNTSSAGTQGNPDGIPAHPHPDELLCVVFSGFPVTPTGDRNVHDVAAYYAAHPESEGEPISGDQTARWRHLQCGDPDPEDGTRCRGPEHCAAAPHGPGTGWVHPWPTYRDIAHVLYPCGIAPEPVVDAPVVDENVDGPVQLDLLGYLASLT